jgi:energy-coupling factor transporter transmembrane protein EcfT
MAELTFFSYHPGRSLLHKLDIRFKMIALVFLSFACMNAYFATLSALSFLTIGLIAHACLPLKSVFKELRYFFILLGVVFLARVLSTPGTPIVQLSLITLSGQGLFSGIIVCWRLLVIVLLGLLFVSTSRPSQIKSAVEWFLKPVPFVSGTRVATMLSLIIRFLPEILYQARETAEAQKARGLGNRKNPIYRLKKLGIPLLRRIFENADKLVVAMEARCFCEKRTDPELSAVPKDWLILLLVGIFCIFTILL